MANITVSTNQPNVTVNSTSSVVTVASSNTIVSVSNTAVLANGDIRAAINVSNLSGYGNLTYDSSVTSNGIIQYTGVSNADIIGVIDANPANVRTAISATDPVVYNSSTGVISVNNTTLLSGQTTTNLTEGTNLYYTDTRFDTRLATKTTTNLTEGTNLYYTNERVRDTIGNTLVGGANITITPDDANNIVTISADLTGDITGVTAGDGLTGGGTSGTVTLDVGSGYGITVNANSIEVTNADIQAQANIAIGNNTTDNLTEGATNLYWTTARGNAATVAYFADSGNAPFTIAGNLDIAGNLNYENVTDLYVTDQKIVLNANAASDSTVDIIAYRPVAGSNAVLTWNETSDVWEFNDGSSTYTMPRTTTDLTEGTNLYYTDTRVDAEIQANVTGGYGITFNLDNSIEVTNVEIQAQANIAIGDNTTDNLTEGSTNLYYTNSRVRTTMSNTLVGGSNITITPDLANNIITIDADLTGDITGVTAGSGLTGGGTAGDVTLDVGAGLGITVNADNVAVDMTAFTTDDLAEGSTNLYYSNTLVENYLANSNVSTIDANTITANAFIGGTFTGDGSDLADVRAESVEVTLKNADTVTIPKGYPVHATGYSGSGEVECVLADASNAELMPAHFIAQEELANVGDTGRGILAGRIQNVDTSTFSIGDTIYVAVGGGYANTAPTGEGNLIQNLGIVTRLDANVGGGEVMGAGRTAATPNLDEGNIFLGSSSNTAITVTPDTNFDTLGNTFSLSNALVDINKIDSETDTAFTLYGEGGIEFNKKVDSTESRIVDITTTGYSIAEPTLPADFTVGTNQPAMLVSLILTAGSTTAIAKDIFGNAFGGGGDVSALRGPGFNATFPPGAIRDIVATTNYATPGEANVEAAFTTAGISAFGLTGTNGINNPSAGLYGQDKGWRAYDLTSASYTTAFPANAYVTGMSGSTITFSEPALITSTMAAPRTIILFPGMAQTTANNTQLKYFVDTAPGANSDTITTFGTFSYFDLPETLSNTTFDAVSYGNTSTVTMSSIGMKNISDFTSTDESATRFKRGLLVGGSTTPDPVSGRSLTNSPSALGVILENDGESYTGSGAPAPRFLLNNYTGNLDDLTVLPTWAQSGATGNITLDLPQVKTNVLTFKAFRGAKSTEDIANYTLHAGEVVGKIAFAPAQTDGTGYQGIDNINQPAAITVDVGDSDVTYVANTYMHITTTPDPTNIGYMRNNANVNNGGNQQTNFTTKGGNVTLAAQTNGMISLAPTPDYGDASNSTVWTRFAGSTHEYHRFMDVGFLDKTNKTGTFIEIQPISGQTTGSGGLSYDSGGNATLRLSVQESNTVTKSHWDITSGDATTNLFIGHNGTDLVEISDTTATFTGRVIGAGSATDSGATVSFTEPTIYGNATTALTGAISNNLTGAKLGVVQKIYHNDGSVPSFPAGWVQLGTTTYSTGVLNIIYAEWAEGSRVEYWINQE